MPSQAMQDVIDGLREQQKASASQAPPTLEERRAAFAPAGRIHPVPDAAAAAGQGPGNRAGRCRRRARPPSRCPGPWTNRIWIWRLPPGWLVLGSSLAQEVAQFTVDGG